MPEERRRSKQATSDRWARENGDRLRLLRRRSWLKRYGLTIEDYDELLAAQGGRCAICRALPEKQRLSVDHDHETGEVRGLLCAVCNRDVGRFEKHRERFLGYLGITS